VNLTAAQHRSVSDAPHVILVHRYFWPDTPTYAQMLRSIAERLDADGFRVSVLTAQPSYGGSAVHDRAPRRETMGRVAIRRLGLLPEQKNQTLRRVVNLFGFAAKASVQILRADSPQVVMAATTPPLLVAAMTSMAARMRGAAFVYHSQDIYPEVLGGTGGVVARRLQTIARWVDTRSGRRADRVVVLSQDMAQTWTDRGTPETRIAVINNFFDPSAIDEAAAAEVPPVGAGQRRLVFAGNVGGFQDLEGLVDAVARLDDDRLQLFVVGDGVALDRCREAASAHTHFVGRTSPGDAQAWIESADAAVVTLGAGLIRYVYPSKTFAYLQGGVPLFVRIEPDSELGQLVVTNDVGWAVAPDDPVALDNALRSFMAADQATLDAMGRRAEALAASRNSLVALDAWVDLFRLLSAPDS